MSLICGGSTTKLRSPATQASAEKSNSVRRSVVIFKANGTTRRGLLSLVLMATVTPEASDSRKTLIQEYLKRSKEKKEQNDKERQDDYYKRNYGDYFGLLEGSIRGKSEEELSESDKGILEWLQKNRK